MISTRVFCVRYQHQRNATLLLLVLMTSLTRTLAITHAQLSPDFHDTFSVGDRFKSGKVTTSLLIATGDGVRQISLDGHNATQHLLQGSRTSCLDYDFGTNTMFWSSYKDRKMYRGEIGEGVEKSIVVHDPYSNIYAIGYDWIYGNVYWTDNDKNEISVSTKNGTFKKLLFNDKISLPSSIAVNPLSGWMHWADTKFNRIERAAMDGTGREVVLSADDVRHPSALTIDFTQNRIYWTQNDPFSISSSDFDGSDRKVIYTGNQQQSSSKMFKAIATFQDSVYWIESNSRTVYKVNKDDGGNFVGLFKYNSTLYDIKVYDAARQPHGENLCTKRTEQCSHFCFPVPVSVSARSTTDNGSVSTSCACPNGLNLSGDGRNCI